MNLHKKAEMSNSDGAGVLPVAALGGALLVSGGGSYYALNNQITELSQNIKKSDIHLIKMIRIVSNHNDSILKIEDIEEAANKNSKLINELMETSQELLQRLREAEYDLAENTRHLKHIENYLLLDEKYEPYYNNYRSEYDSTAYDNYGKNNDYQSQYDKSYESSYNRSYGTTSRKNINEDSDDEDDLLQKMRSRR